MAFIGHILHSLRRLSLAKGPPPPLCSFPGKCNWKRGFSKEILDLVLLMRQKRTPTSVKEWEWIDPSG